jgi:hypothetical protein
MASVYERDFSAGLSGKYSLVFERVNAGKKVLETWLLHWILPAALTKILHSDRPTAIPML